MVASPRDAAEVTTTARITSAIQTTAPIRAIVTDGRIAAIGPIAEFLAESWTFGR